MMQKDGRTDEGGFTRYFLLFDLCALLFAAWLLLLVTGLDSRWTLGLQFAWLLILIALFSRKRRDEFARYCWGKASEAAFAMLIVAPIVGAFAMGLIEGFTGRDSAIDVTLDSVMAVVFATFFSVFEATRLRDNWA